MTELDAEQAPPSGARIVGVVRWALIVLMAAAAASAWLWCADAGSRFAQAADHYHCPMHPSTLRDRPGECGICGMALVPVAHDLPRDSEEPAASAVRAGKPGGPVPGLVPVRIAPERTQLVGVRTAKVTRDRLTSQLRTVAVVSADDSAIAIATTRFSGWVEEVRVMQGQRVEKGQVLATVSGPELLTAQQVFLAGREWTAKRKGPATPAQAGRNENDNTPQRLGIARQDIERVARLNRPVPALPLRAAV